MDRLQQVIDAVVRNLSELPLSTPQDAQMVARARDTIVSEVRAILAQPPADDAPEEGI